LDAGLRLTVPAIGLRTVVLAASLGPLTILVAVLTLAAGRTGSVSVLRAGLALAIAISALLAVPLAAGLLGPLAILIAVLALAAGRAGSVSVLATGLALAITISALLAVPLAARLLRPLALLIAVGALAGGARRSVGALGALRIWTSLALAIAISALLAVALALRGAIARLGLRGGALIDGLLELWVVGLRRSDRRQGEQREGRCGKQKALHGAKLRGLQILRSAGRLAAPA